MAKWREEGSLNIAYCWGTNEEFKELGLDDLTFIGNIVAESEYSHCYGLADVELAEAAAKRTVRENLLRLAKERRADYVVLFPDIPKDVHFMSGKVQGKASLYRSKIPIED